MGRIPQLQTEIVRELSRPTSSPASDATAHDSLSPFNYATNPVRLAVTVRAVAEVTTYLKPIAPGEAEGTMK